MSTIAYGSEICAGCDRKKPPPGRVAAGQQIGSVSALIEAAFANLRTIRTSNDAGGVATAITALRCLSFRIATNPLVSPFRRLHIEIHLVMKTHPFGYLCSIKLGHFIPLSDSVAILVPKLDFIDLTIIVGL